MSATTVRRAAPRVVLALGLLVASLAVVAQGQLVADEALRRRLPAMFQDASLVERGGFAAYGINYRELGLAGAKPADLPVENYHRLEPVLDLATARAVGISIPPDVLLRADRVVVE